MGRSKHLNPEMGSAIYAIESRPVMKATKNITTAITNSR
jgi:hypothetical protein